MNDCSTESSRLRSLPVLIVSAVPALIVAARITWTFSVLERYDEAIAHTGYSVGQAAHFHRVAFLWPDTVVILSLLVFCALTALVWWRHRRALVWTALLASILSFVAEHAILLNSYFSNFKEFT